MNFPPVLNILLKHILPVISPIIANHCVLIHLVVVGYIFPWMLFHNIYNSFLRKINTIKYIQVHTIPIYTTFFNINTPINSQKFIFSFGGGVENTVFSPCDNLLFSQYQHECISTNLFWLTLFELNSKLLLLPHIVYTHYHLSPCDYSLCLPFSSCLWPFMLQPTPKQPSYCLTFPLFLCLMSG